MIMIYVQGVLCIFWASYSLTMHVIALVHIGASIYWESYPQTIDGTDIQG